MVLQMVAQHVSDLALDDSFYKTISNFDKNFTETLVQLLTAISELNAETKLLHILYRYALAHAKFDAGHCNIV